MNIAAIALGGNLPVQGIGGPIAVMQAALHAIRAEGSTITNHSRWYWSAAVPDMTQPLFVNGVAVIRTALAPVALLSTLLTIEARFKRIRTQANQPRTLDLDLLTYGDLIVSMQNPDLILPHPRMHARAFVLAPLEEAWPNWRHPSLKLTSAQLRRRIDDTQWLQPIGC